MSTILDPSLLPTVILLVSLPLRAAHLVLIIVVLVCTAHQSLLHVLQSPLIIHLLHRLRLLLEPTLRDIAHRHALLIANAHRLLLDLLNVVLTSAVATTAVDPIIRRRGR